VNAAVEVDPVQFLVEAARTNFAAFVSAVHRPRFHHSAFSLSVCAAVDQFVDDLIAGKRPVLMLTAPPQHGKSSLISRCLGPYLFGRLAGKLGNGSDGVRIACASYALALARRNARDAKSIMGEPIYREIFPHASLIGFRGTNTAEAFDTPGGGGLRGVGVGGSLTGFSVDVGLLDDPTKDQQEALSVATQDNLEAWFDSVLMTRLQECSGLVIIGTPWSSGDLLARVKTKMGDDPRLTVLSFPAINLPDEIGYVPELPEGALVPKLHSLTKLREMQKHIGEFWWAALFQQVPLSEFGAIFKRGHVQYYRRAELPKMIRTIMSVDATFKGNETSDYVFVGVWGKTVDERVYLLDWRREKLAFMATARAIADLKVKHSAVSRIYIEDAANGAALVDMLKKHFPMLEGVPPLGSKEARAHAVSWVWENNMVHLPHPDESPGIKPVVAEITAFPDVKNDDAVDGMTIALQQLCLRNPISAMITRDILARAAL